jgi:hypothetical protein
MITKALAQAMFESSLLSKSGVPLDEGWQAILESYPEPEVAALFSALKAELAAAAPSLKPFTDNAALDDDAAVACNFAELAANTSLYERFWSDMAIAYLLKRKVSSSAPSDADVRLGSYLLSSGDGLPEMSLRAELESWSDAPNWEFPEGVTGEFPEDWWDALGISTGDVQFPRTISMILRKCLQGGTLDSVIPEIATSWTRFAQAADRLLV